MKPQKGDPLVPAVAEFTATISRPTGSGGKWKASLRDALARLETALLSHDRLADAPDGLLAPVNRPIHSNQPTLDHDVGHLRIVRQAFLDRIQKVRQQLDAHRDEDADDRKHLREEGQALADSMREYLESETLLVQDTVNTDIGCLD